LARCARHSEFHRAIHAVVLRATSMPSCILCHSHGVMHTWGSRKHMAFKIEGQVASRIVIKVASRIVIKVASRIVIKVASRIVIRTLLTSCTQGILVQKMNMYEYMYFIFKIAK
jgi:hypothetical protein